MTGERDEALEEFLAAFDRRLEAAPVIDRRDRSERRAHPAGMPVDGHRSHGPAKEAFAYWESKTGSTD